jgi:hypothetical protein
MGRPLAPSRIEPDTAMPTIAFKLTNDHVELNQLL